MNDDEQLVGLVIRRHTSEGFQDVGRIVHVSATAQKVWYVPMSGRYGPDTGKRVFHIGSPRDIELAKLRLQEEDRTISFVDFDTPPEWHLSDQELSSGISPADLGKGSRRSLTSWYSQRETQKSWIQPIVEAFGVRELLECNALGAQVRKRAIELGHKSPNKVARAMRLFLFGCGSANALLPRWSASGARGTQKFAVTKPGKPRRDVARKLSDDKGYVCDESDRRKLASGWFKYKKKDVSVEDAYLLTCNEYWSGIDTTKVVKGNTVRLLHPLRRPTSAQFRRAGEIFGESARSINMGKRVHALSVRALYGSSKDGVMAVGQLGLIDSTSEDLTPVSVISRLKVLPSTWRTVHLDVRSEYILGLYSGFEHPSTLTSLLAILHGASSKVEFCARYGISISEDEWHSRVCKRIRADNGELKSEKGIKTLSQTEVSLEFVQSYRGDQKGLVEASHKKVHRKAGHKIAGSTRGRQRGRGEAPREADACRTFPESMPSIIKAVLFHNNEEPVPDLLTVEMRQDGVLPTRKAIYEWLVAKGYVASEPANLSLLRAQCLPRLRAKILRDGVHIFDPREPTRYIPQLRYTSRWLLDSRLCEAGGRKRLDCEVMLHPTDLSRCFFFKDGMQELERVTSDPLANDLTLLEHLEMTDDDKSLVDSMKDDVESSNVSNLVATRAMNSAARSAKKAEKTLKQLGETNTKTSTHDKRQNRIDELELSKLEQLGLPLVAKATHIDQKEQSEPHAPYCPDYRPLRPAVNPMDEIRRRRSAR